MYKHTHIHTRVLGSCRNIAGGTNGLTEHTYTSQPPTRSTGPPLPQPPQTHHHHCCPPASKPHARTRLHTQIHTHTDTHTHALTYTPATQLTRWLPGTLPPTVGAVTNVSYVLYAIHTVNIYAVTRLITHIHPFSLSFFLRETRGDGGEREE